MMPLITAGMSFHPRPDRMPAGILIHLCAAAPPTPRGYRLAEVETFARRYHGFGRATFPPVIGSVTPVVPGKVIGRPLSDRTAR